MSKTYELSTGMELIDKPGSLDYLAVQIRIAHFQANRHANKATQGAIIAGRLLNEAKAQVKHGEWDNWLTSSNCAVAPRTARAYMRLAASVPLLDESNRQRVAVLPLREAMLAMRAISTDPTAPPKQDYTNIRAVKRTDAVKAVAVFGKAEKAIKDSKRLIGTGLTIKGKQVYDLCKKLNDVLAELDNLEAATSLEEMAVAQ